ncbi:HD domain-containing protein [Streptomyces canus]|uniref:HD domain-containing protein n=1 Tax=Streptomyces canus TaxID=58343 RepID=UPI0036770FEC
MVVLQVQGVEGPPDDCTVTALCAGLHDVGKLSGFQLCDARAREGLSGELRRDPGRIGVERMPHEVAGMHATAAVLTALGSRGTDGSVNAAVRRDLSRGWG